MVVKIPTLLTRLSQSGTVIVWEFTHFHQSLGYGCENSHIVDASSPREGRGTLRLLTRNRVMSQNFHTATGRVQPLSVLFFSINS
jgi:hypothetical protein